MKITRLFEIVYLLLDKKSVTAEELARHFEVSSRTIYRDIDTLSEAGIPIYTTKGIGGGIHLTDRFVLNKSVLTDEEKKNILSALQGMDALKINGMKPALDKLSALFGGEHEEWISIDFSLWNPENLIGETFYLLKEAILLNNTLTFCYSGAKGSAEMRTAEPMKLMFKGHDWYLLAWCRLRNAFRFFKLSRMKNLKINEEQFVRRSLPETLFSKDKISFRRVTVKAEITSKMEYRVRDDFSESQYHQKEDGSFLVSFEMPQNEWLYEYLLAYGPDIKVLEPIEIKEELCSRLKMAYRQYEI